MRFESSKRVSINRPRGGRCSPGGGSVLSFGEQRKKEKIKKPEIRETHNSPAENRVSLLGLFSLV